MPPLLHPDVAACDTDDGLVLLDTGTGRYFQLNATAGAILRALLDGVSVARVADMLAASRPVTAEQAATDITALLDDLTRARLITDTRTNTDTSTDPSAETNLDAQTRAHTHPHAATVGADAGMDAGIDIGIHVDIDDREVS
ncbi:lasso peptide biosynthesis PqqD family chaperone [Nonomuraea sp. NPDC050404]|uniref:lasso peptide biosynthesis PqqD family chaperone n=1 Tax=Nonomuraea sp. NPDC050404 TaxID=3155783 RepID=UPI0034055950